MDHYIIKEPVIIEQDIKKSKFISYLYPVVDEEDCKEKIRQLKKEHPKANHHCSAYRVGLIERSSDDGEPASSAGLPMLKTLKGNKLESVLAVVVRYFGGVELGVGGLIRAYSSSVTLAIEASTLMSPKTISTYELSFPYRFINEVESMIGEGVLNRDYDQDLVIYKVFVENEIDRTSLSDITQGTATIKDLGSHVEYV